MSPRLQPAGVLGKMSSWQSVQLSSITPQPWRNGGGSTRELLAWPQSTQWQLRISLASIEADGPFSAFPGVQRWFAVVSGSGVCLRWPDRERQVLAGQEPVQFDGANAPHARLINGPTLDLNLMLQGAGVRGTLSRAWPGEDQQLGSGWCGLYAAGAGQLQHAGSHEPVLDINAAALLWKLTSQPGRLRWQGQAPAWWIHAELPGDLRA